ncbi:NAD(P)H-hydrate dehydratase [Methylophilus aquaticus]|uniref:ADP-dependent (S)-NAD(P)H-hydrate dehydratase n=1 Tax=Methylophilus aquaticus TaxID=1971610 RepID=A0ABT9JV16_9PROT|nr:NAD(P)H-hydrate dehydratase [Methylophilus aquaticus]MDP8568402.1 NAD(P)H-hydrate dehydratase [Methylophilus aquaticus]
MTEPQINHPALWQSLLPQPNAVSHKYTRGYVLIQGGYPVTGAARLAAMAAARSGAGITAIAVPAIAFPIYASQLLSIVVKPYSDDSSLQALINDNRVGALLIGPGASVSDSTRLTAFSMLKTTKPVVIDADALTVFAGKPERLRKSILAPCVLTPHDGEFKTLFNLQPANVLEQRIKQAQLAAASVGCIVLLKGSQTIIADPDGRVILNQPAPPTLATAGAGDVLAGIITSLLAQEMPALEAAAAATWIHAEAARLCGVGMIADDLPELIPTILQGLMPSE